MKTILKLEYAALFFLALMMFARTEISWWWFALLFFLPDLSMVGYAINTKVGAVLYNIFHHFGTAVLLFFVGKILGFIYLEVAGIILLAHSAFDRILGYGLKYPDSFQNTHLGRIGNN